MVEGLSHVELDDIRNRCNAASPGPWKSFVEGRDHVSGSNFIMVGSGEARRGDLEPLGTTVADLEFIAHARQDVPALLEEIARLKEKRASSLSDDELDEMRRRCSEATSGPWRSYVEGRDHASGSNFIMVGFGESPRCDIRRLGGTVADQDFVAHARQDMPRLLDEVARLRMK